MESLLSGVILPRGPGDLKKVGALHIDELSLTLEGDKAEYMSLFQLLNAETVVEDLKEMAVGTTLPPRPGVKTRARALVDEQVLQEEDILKIYQETDDYGVEFDI